MPVPASGEGMCEHPGDDDAASDRELLLAFDSELTQPAVHAWLEHLHAVGAPGVSVTLGATTIIAIGGLRARLAVPAGLPAPTRVVTGPHQGGLAHRQLRPEGTVVRIGPTRIGDHAVAVFAGPCAVEGREQLLATAAAVAAAGAVGLRGGAFKPRTSPRSFQGLGWEGLRLLAEARARVGLPILTEVVDPRHVQRLAATVDGFQIGARNMQNFALLSEVGKTGKPVVLKRGFGCPIDELLAASEYILAQGNDQLVLCERGIRTFDTATRFTLDLAGVAALKQRTHLPIMVDPSHAVGTASLVEPMALAAAAAGADALIVDVHVQPETALCDGNQALRPQQFTHLMDKLASLCAAITRRLASTDQGGRPVVERTSLTP